MPGLQEIVALSIVALVAGRLLWRRWSRRKGLHGAGGKSGACGDCASSGPAPKEATVHFYRRQNPPENPAGRADGEET